MGEGGYGGRGGSSDNDITVTIAENDIDGSKNTLLAANSSDNSGGAGGGANISASGLGGEGGVANAAGFGGPGGDGGYGGRGLNIALEEGTVVNSDGGLSVVLDGGRGGDGGYGGFGGADAEADGGVGGMAIGYGGYGGFGGRGGESNDKISVTIGESGEQEIGEAMVYTGDGEEDDPALGNEIEGSKNTLFAGNGSSNAGGDGGGINVSAGG